jgi:aminopeptidase N
LLAHDTDPFNRWEQGNMLARTSMLHMILEGGAPDPAFLAGIKAVVTDATLDPAFRQLMIGWPGDSELAGILHGKGHVPDPAALYQASEAMGKAMAATFADVAMGIYETNQVKGRYQPNAEQTGMRSLAGIMLSLISRTDGGTLAAAQYDRADNMTEQLRALNAVVRYGKGDEKLKAFEAQWRDDRLVMDKWFGLQVAQSRPDDTVATVKGLTEHPDFNWKNPNRFRAVLGMMAGHHAGFHHVSGAGYTLLADWLIRLDPLNPQTTARMCSAFQTWRRYDTARQDMIGAELERILATPNLSRDTTEMLTRIAGAPA